ncbi:putative glucocorticoid modulatory element-binding protein 1-like [Scophthalmus maximus]|uniref:Putative glucocorticoid modulatory element-binding protein 1-like n=1 Tax=Scophthalmus maximus TaxID=52904 RepID=A0A2U9AYY3_SCOMX|nr:putative glucocorticoid modulatory element-binding protein 1-like [Scophthalmus maximus]
MWENVAPCRVNEDTADTGTTVLAIETHHDHSKAEGEEIEYGYPITCGDSRAVLLFKKFVCPGINVRCVKFNDQLISPKQFVHLAGKATLKDWKRAIRLGGVMLRKMMDSGQIDFFQHDTVCSNTCRSTKFDVLINSTRLPPGTSVQPSPSSLALDPPGGQVPPLTELVRDAAEVEETLWDRFGATAEWSPGPVRPINPATANGHAAKRKRADTPDGVFSLWKGVADSGLMGEVLSSLQTELLATLKGVEVRSEKANLQETDAVILNSLCEMFGLLDSVKQALDLRRSQSEESKIHDNAYVMDEILEARGKRVCDKSTSLKLLRRQRHNPSSSQTQSVLSPVKTSPVFQPLSVTGLSAASYAQLFSHVSALTGLHHHNRVGRMDRFRNHELSELGGKEKVHRRAQETSGNYKEPELRTGKSREALHLRSQEEEETDGVHDIEKVIIKSSKKHKSK